MEDFNQALRLNPKYAEAYYFRGYMQFESGNVRDNQIFTAVPDIMKYRY